MRTLALLLLAQFLIACVWARAPRSEEESNVYSSLARGLDQVIENGSTSPSLQLPQHGKCLPKDEVKGDYCEFIQARCDFGTVFEFLRLYWCTSLPRALTVILSLIILVVLFYILAVAADSYFCPVLSKLATKLHMSDEIAGMTILALGNGSADVSATFAAVNRGNFGIAIGELLGAGLFVTTVVVASVALTARTEVESSSFLRDISFYLLGVAFVIPLVWSQSIYLWESLLLLSFYLIYVLFAVVRHYYAHHLERERLTHYESVRENDQVDWGNVEDIELESFLPDEDEGAFIEHLEGVNDGEVDYWTLPGWKQDFLSKSIFQKALYILTLPCWLPLALTIPNVEKWSRALVVVIPTLSPPFVLFALGLHDVVFTPSFLPFSLPLIDIILLFGVICSILVALTTHWDHWPRYSVVFTVYAFFVAILWIYVAASELVGLLQSLGIAFSIPSVILGATVLAWGNSVSDLVSNIMMASHGAPRMAIAACLGGPFFNMFFGLGASLVYKTSMLSPEPYLVKTSHLFYITIMFVIVSLVISLVSVPLLLKYKLTKKYAICLIAFYALYTLVALLSATGVLWPDHQLL